MLLSDKTIRGLIDSGDVKVFPFPEDAQYQPISLDLTLGTSYCRPWRHAPDERWISGEAIIRPGEFFLANTSERVELPAHIAGLVHGKSTWARRGLLVEAAGLVDPGFKGTITLELKNIGAQSLLLSAGKAICQMTFHAVDVAVLRPYGSAGLNSHYQGQENAEPARQ